MQTNLNASRLARALEIIFNVIVGFCAVAVLGTIIFMAAVGLSTNRPGSLSHEVEIQTSLPSQDVVTDNGETVTLNLERISARLELASSQKGLSLLHAQTGLISLLLISAACWHLRQFVRRARLDHPFTPDNARRLRTVAWLCLGLLVWQAVREIVMALALNSAFPHLDLSVSLQLTAAPLIAVLGLMVIAEIFNLGVRMKEEQDLTV